MQFTLQETARILGIDTKTLKRKLQRAEIVPTPDTIDRRRLLLSEEQLAHLTELMGRDLPAVLRGTEAPIPDRETVEQWLARMADDIQTLRRRIVALDDEIRVLRMGLLGLARGVQPASYETYPSDASLDG